MSKSITVKWSTSKGQDTYGYAMVTVRDQQGRKVGRAMGGGYDLQGAAVGEWAEKAYQAQLLQLARKRTDSKRNYGLTLSRDGKRALVDGSCGLSCVFNMLEAVGVKLSSVYSDRKTDVYSIDESAA